MNRFTYPDGKISEVFWPPQGLNKGGTCEFITSTCAKECGLVSNKAHEYSYKFFLNSTVNEITDKIFSEMGNDKTKLLSWFAAGDCPSDYTDKVLSIMSMVSESGIIQHGFTRNHKLWQGSQSIDNCNIAFTVEIEEEAVRLSRQGIVSVPDYKTWRSYIYSNEKQLSLCGGGWVTCGSGFVEEEDEVYVEDCHLCYSNKRGCFYE